MATAAGDCMMTYDEALTKHVGQFGPGQWRSLLWASLPQIANAASWFLWTFITVASPWVCVDDSDSTCAAVFAQDATSSSMAFCSLPPDSWRWTNRDSLVAKFNLVCGDAWKVQFTNSLMFMGAFLGSGLFGFLCDRWGRKKPLFLSTALVAASMYASLAAPSYWVMAALRAVTGIGAAGQAHCIFLLSTEPVGPDFRGFAGTATLLFFTVGEFLMVALAYALPSWQHLVLATACINAGALLLYPLVSESARWLLSKGRTEEATALLQRLADTNKSSLPAQSIVSSGSRTQLPVVVDDASAHDQAAAAEEGRVTSQFSIASVTLVDEAEDEAQEGEAPLGLCSMLRQRRLAIRFLVLLVNWFSLMLNYYGIAMGSGGIPGSIYLTFAIGVVAEVVALLVVGPTVDRLGRHNIVAAGQLVGGAACIACSTVSSSLTQAVLAGVGKFGCSAAESVISIYTAELLPTSCRSSVMGVCSQASRLGSITAPFLLMLGAQLPIAGQSQVFIPFLVFGSLTVLGGLLTMLMPETLGAAMPEKVEDLNMLLSAFTAKPWRKGCSPLIAFIFRTKADAAYTGRAGVMSTQPASTCPPHVSTVSKTGAARSGKKKVAFDSRSVADGDRKASLYGDDSELCVASVQQPAKTAESSNAGAVVVSVQVAAEDSASSSGRSA